MSRNRDAASTPCPTHSHPPSWRIPRPLFVAGNTVALRLSADVGLEQRTCLDRLPMMCGYRYLTVDVEESLFNVGEINVSAKTTEIRRHWTAPMANGAGQMEVAARLKGRRKRHCPGASKRFTDKWKHLRIALN